jgi:signal transduction histidine kinase
MSPLDSQTEVCAQLLSLAVHELRTPASVVSGYLRMLMRDTESPLSDRQRKMIEEAEKSCTRLVAVIAEMSEVAKLDAGTVTLARDRFDLFSVVGDVAKGVHEAADREVRLEVRGAASGAAIVGDATRVRAAIDAIFRAVLREQPAACTVVVDRRVDRSADGSTRAVLVVAPDARVQAAYGTDPAPFDDKRGGLGLALPIARRVVEGLGGRLWAPPPPDERGAAILSFPVAE